jgi:hypothetical protein
MQKSTLSVALATIFSLLVSGCGWNRKTPERSSQVPPTTAFSTEFKPPSATLEIPFIPLDINVDLTGKVSLETRSQYKIPTLLGTLKLSPGGIKLSNEDVQKIEEGYEGKRLLIVRVDDDISTYELKENEKFELTINHNDKLFNQISVRNNPSDDPDSIIVELESVPQPTSIQTEEPVADQPSDLPSTKNSKAPDDHVPEPGVLQVADISGIWKGELYQELPNGVIVRYLYALNLTQNGNKVGGTAMLQTLSPPGHFVERSIAGKISGDVFKFSDKEIIRSVPPGSWCVKSVELTNNESALQGSWASDACGFGQVSLSR